MNYKTPSLIILFLVTEYLYNSKIFPEEKMKIFVMSTYGSLVQVLIDITNGVYL